MPVAKWFCGINSAPLFVGVFGDTILPNTQRLFFKNLPLKDSLPPQSGGEGLGMRVRKANKKLKLRNSLISACLKNKVINIL